MFKIKWSQGLPTEHGFYWIDNGCRFGDKEHRYASILTVSPMPLSSENKNYNMWGHYGTLQIEKPTAKIYESVKCAPIDDPEIWVNQTAITTNKSIAWVKTHEERLGLALLTTITGKGIISTVIWQGSPYLTIDMGATIHPDDEYSFSPIEPPLLK